jgi:RNA polymerase sigma-70 factor (ECF subfamily)
MSESIRVLHGAAGGTRTQADNNDAAARVEALVRAETPRLLGYFARRVVPRTDAADLLGETLLVLWRRADSLPEDPEQARMWMYGVARRVLATHRRGASRRSALGDRLRGELSLDGGTAGIDGSSAAEPADDRLDAVRAALERLSASDRDLIALVHWDGFTVAEASRLLHLRLSTGRSRYHRARNRLKAEIEAAGL